MDQLPKFAPTQEMIEAAETLVIAMAWHQTVKPVVEGYQKEILARHQFTNRGEIEQMERANLQHGRTKVDVKVVTDPFDSFCLAKEDFAIYDAECHEAKLRSGLQGDTPDSCPLLSAEMMQIRAERGLVDALRHITQLAADDALGVSLKSYKRLVDISLRLMVPFIKSDLLKDLKPTL